MEDMVMNYGWLSLLPPLIAIGLALKTKEVIPSLTIGIFAGAIILSSGNPVGAVETTVDLMAANIADNGVMILFLSLLGCLVAAITRAGGARAYGNWAIKGINTHTKALLATKALGLLFFIDDYFNCLTTGTVMKPVTDKFRISRAKLAYFIDATAAPIAIIAPISSWAVSVAGSIESAGLENGMAIFIKTIPFNLYAALTLIITFYFCFPNTDVGPMKKVEDEFTKTGKDPSKLANEEDMNIPESENGTIWDLILPIGSLILFVVLFMLKTGGFFSGEAQTIGEAFGNCDSGLSLALGSFCAIIVAFIMFVPRKLMTFSEFMQSMNEGVVSMVPALIILVLAWSIGAICNTDHLNTGGFIGDLIMNNNIPLAVIPPVIFVAAALLSFATGTAWGTFLLLVPIMVPVIQKMDAMSHLYVMLGAIFAGAVFGDHCSPISDTTILSSASSGCNHIVHVETQIPYALVVAIACAAGYIVGGITASPLLTFGAGLVVMALGVFVLSKIRSTSEVES